MKNNLSFIIIIANYNGEQYLTKCLDSIKKTKYRNYKVCIVDDGSTDSSVKIIESFQKELDLDLLCQKHGGASKARNVAIKKYQDNSDILVFLDNDTEVEPDWLDALHTSFDSQKEAGGFQCLLIDFEKRDRIQSNGIFLIPHVCWGIAFQSGDKVLDLNKNPIPCAAISAGLAIRSKVIKEVGGFDEKLAVTTEDLDFTWRIWIYGYSIFNCPESKIYHYSKNMSQRKVMGTTLESQYFHLSKNSFRTLLKNYSLKSLFWFLPQSFLINFLRAVLVLIKRRDSSSLKAFFRAVYWNIINLNETLVLRKKIQKCRLKSDKSIYNTIMVRDSLFDIYEKYFKQSKLL